MKKPELRFKVMDDALIIEESLDSLIGAAIRSAQAAEGNEKLPFLREVLFETFPVFVFTS